VQRKLIAILVVGSFAAGLAAAAPADDVKRLLDEGKAAEAYQQGRQHPEELGNPAFDLSYGIAAVDAGHASEGVLALERYLLNFPNDHRARLELARAYFVLGEDVRAREEFEAVRAMNPPAEVQAAIERYTDAIRAREGNYQTTASFYVEAGVGSDSNVNGGVSGASINLPVLGNVQVDATGVRNGDTFNHFAVGGQVSTPVAPGVALMAGGNYDTKQNFSDKDFDLESITGFGGVAVRQDADVYRLIASYNTLSVGRNRYRDAAGIGGEWMHQLDELQSVGASLQYAELDYIGANQVRNARLTGLGASYRKAFIAPMQPILNVGVNFGEEHNRRDRPDLGRDMAGFNVGLNLSPLPRWGVNLGYAYQDSRYNGMDALLNVTRRDTNQSVSLGAVYLYDKNISIRGDVGLSENKSNLELYSYRRTIGSINVRYDFK
jgi:tetratricopeptide (TPR) repeat protein